MRLVCSVAISNRLLSTVPSTQTTKYVKSTLALCRHPKTEHEFMIIHFTAQNKTGTKYKLNDNLMGVSMRFVAVGKATIQFKTPAHNLLITGEPIQLKGFLHLMRRALDKQISDKELTVSSVAVCAVPQSSLPVKKLVVKNRGELPLKGFPRSLETLVINEINLCKLCIGVLQLQKLRVLDISNNCIEWLPLELAKLPIQDLNLSSNKLYKSTVKQWGWIGGTIAKTLRKINLAENELEFLPEQFVKLQALNVIRLDTNRLRKLPSGFGNFRNLRILSVANNELTQVPGSMRRLHLDSLDLTCNIFKRVSVAKVYPKQLPVCTLKEYAARKVLLARLPYCSETIPFSLVDYLDYAHYCGCGKPCFEVHFYHVNLLMLNSIAQNIVQTMIDHHYVPIDCYYCSVRCFRRMTHPAMYN